MFKKDSKTTDIVEQLMNTNSALTLEKSPTVEEATKEVFKRSVKTNTDSFTESALGLVKNKTTGLWNIIQIKYDPDTLAVDSNVNVIPSNDTAKVVGMERFKINVSNLIFGK